MKYDVAVIGGGPAGSATAISCASRGLSVVIIERSKFPRDRPGESLHPGIEPLFDELGVGDQVRAASFRRYPGHWVELNGALEYQSFGADKHGQWFGFHALRSQLDEILLDRARSAGSALIQGVSIRSASLHHVGVVGLKIDSEAIEANFTVDATGASHWLGRQLEIDLVPYSPPLFAKYGYALGPPLREPIFRNMHGSWTWLAGIGRGIYAWASVSTSPQVVAIPELAFMRPLTRPRGANVTWRILDRVAGPGWFAVGDAAAVLDPSSSHGVLRALMSGMMVGDLIVRVLRDRLSRELATKQYAHWLYQLFFRDVVRLRLVSPSAYSIPRQIDSEKLSTADPKLSA